MKIVRIQSAQDARDYSLAGRAVFIAAARDFAPSPPLAGMDWDPAKSLLGIQNTRIQNTEYNYLLFLFGNINIVLYIRGLFTINIYFMYLFLNSAEFDIFLELATDDKWRFEIMKKFDSGVRKVHLLSEVDYDVQALIEMISR